MIRQIPKYLLPHTATLMKTEERDAWGKETQSVFTLRHCRVEPSHGRVVTLTAEMPEVKARLFIDAVNTECEGGRPAEGDRVIFGGKEFSVQRVSEYYADDKLHHTECDLV